MLRIAAVLIVAGLTMTLNEAADAALIATINLGDGSVSLEADGATSFEGYQLTGPAGVTWQTSDADWLSIVDQGLSTGWVELANSGILAEGNLLGSPLALSDGQVIDLGTPYAGPDDLTTGDFAFSYRPAGGSTTPGVVHVVPVPEPASVLMVSAAALLALARRRRRGLAC